MPLGEYLDLTARFRGERDRNVWLVLLGSLQTLDRLIDAEGRPRLQAFVRDRLGPAAGDLGWEPRAGEDELTSQLRGDLLRALGTLGDDPGVQARAGEVYRKEGAGVDANVLAAVIAVLAHAGDEGRYEEFVRRFRAAPTPQEEQRYLHALAGFRPGALVGRTLEKTVNGEVRTQDAPFLVRSLLYGVRSRERAWEFVRANWERMNRDYPVNGVRRMCEGVIGLARPEWQEGVKEFFRSRQVDLGGKTLEQYLEQLHVMVELRRREGRALHDYLRRW
jgi:puromycin-sensitive aminopeptidase